MGDSKNNSAPTRASTPAHAQARTPAHALTDASSKSSLPLSLAADCVCRQRRLEQVRIMYDAEMQEVGDQEAADKVRVGAVVHAILALKLRVGVAAFLLQLPASVCCRRD